MVSIFVAAPASATELVLEPSYRVHQSDTLGDDKRLDIDLRLTSTLGFLPPQLQFEVRAGWRSFSYLGDLDGVPLTIGPRFYILDGMLRPSIYAAGGAFFGYLEQFDNAGSVISPLISFGAAFDVVVSEWVGGVYVGWEKYFHQLGISGFDPADWVMAGLRFGRQF